MRMLGRHVLVEFYECNRKILNDQLLIQKYMEEAAFKSQATIVNSVFHTFNPHGVSGVVVIAESHMAIHTWPEYHYAAVDLFTCGTKVKPWLAFDHLKTSLKAMHFTTREIKRGLPDTAGSRDTLLSYKPMVSI